ncbi:MAG: polysaccharide deacetylase, partial [Solirubrobacterales bacterium]|nr:polysaccharide deacetylase [Solirubrobacterales bacterium]
IRRRRIAAAAVLAAVLLALVAVAPGSLSRGSHPPRPASSANTGPGVHAAKAHAHRALEEDPSVAVKAVLAYTPFVKAGGDRGRDVALTFDDGPGPYTPAVLGVLERLHVHATFFEIGEMLRYFSASTVRELRDGDVIGDHTQTHPEMATLSAHAQHEELFEQILHIELLDGPRPTLFRPPYGSYNATTMRQLRALHLLMVLWSVDTDDYLQPGVPVIVQRALAGAHPGAIILMHDAGGTRTQTIAALPMIIDKLRARGFLLVTDPELLRDDPPPPGQTLPSSLRGD